MSDNKQDQPVGYGRPPKHHQFKQGQSGNPNGRPKGRQSLQAMFEKQLYRNTSVRIDGRAQTMSVLEAGVIRLVQQFLQGTPERALAILKMASSMMLKPQEATAEFDYSSLDDEELDALERILSKLHGVESISDREQKR